MTTCPVCNMQVDQATSQNKSTYLGKTYNFCSSACKTQFEANPAQYTKQTAAR